MKDTSQSSPSVTSPQSGQYDTVSKDVVQANPEDWIRFFLNIPDAQVIEVLDTEQPTVRSNRADSFIHTNILGKEAIVHFEFQTRDSTGTPMPYRMAGYAGRGVETFKMDVYSHVVYLHPDAGRSDPGRYVQNMPGYEIAINYKVIRLCELEGQAILDARLKGLIPFAPLMKPPETMDSGRWLRECIRVADSILQDESHKADYLTDTAILSGLIFEYQTIREIISEETMYESSVIQYFTQQGIEQGERKSSIESILEALEIRFQPSEIDALKPALERIEELQHLKRLRRAAMQVSSLDAFKRLLTSNGS